MVKIYRTSDEVAMKNQGYFGDYVADIELKAPITTAGVIIVTIPEGTTAPHAHAELEELFIAISDVDMYIDNERYTLKKGDVALVAPGEFHYFEAPKEQSSSMIAIKLPNIKKDKIESVQ